LARNQDNVSDRGNMSIRGLLFQWASTIKIQLSMLSSTKRTSSSSHWKLICSCYDKNQLLQTTRTLHHTYNVPTMTHWCRCRPNTTKTIRICCSKQLVPFITLIMYGMIMSCINGSLSVKEMFFYTVSIS